MEVPSEPAQALLIIRCVEFIKMWVRLLRSRQPLHRTVFLGDYFRIGGDTTAIPVSEPCRLHDRCSGRLPTSWLTEALAWIIEGANLFQFSTNNMTQIDNMIHAVNRLHVENGRDIIAVDNVLLYFYTPDKRQNAREETHYRLAALQFRHQWPFKRHAGCERHGR